MTYLLMEIGCLECQLESKVVGHFDNIELCKWARNILSKNHPESDVDYQIFEIPDEINSIDEEFLEIILAEKIDE